MAWALLLVCLILLGGCGEEKGATVSGDGYEYELPEGWKDRSDSGEVEAIDFLGLTPDTVATGEEVDGFMPNANVLVEPGAGELTPRRYSELSTGILRNPELLPTQAQEQLRGFDPRDFSPAERTDLGGREAYTTDFTGTRDGAALRFRSIVTVRGGKGYTVTFTSPLDSFEDRVDEFEGLTESWRWRQPAGS